MPALIETGVSNQQLLAVWTTNADTGFTPAQLLAAGITSAEMLAAGITVAQMQAAGITLAQIHAGGVTPAQLLAADITSTEMLAAGITVAQMQAAGITLGQIHAGGVSITHLLGTGLSIAQLRTGGVPDYALFNEVCNIPLSSGTAPGPIMRLLSTNLNATNTHVRLEGKAIDSLRWQLPGIRNIIFVSTVHFPNDTTTEGNITGEYIRDEVRDEELTVVSILNIPLSHVFSNLTLTLIDGRSRTTSIQLCPGR